MIINTPAIDYWRATTGSLSQMDDLSRELIGGGDVGEKWHFLQYHGNRFGSVGMGSAVQNGEPSYIIDISGETSDDLFERLVYSDMKMTRLDLQITVPKPKDWDTVEFHFTMEMDDWPNGIKRDVQTRLNKGNDTVYIGDRTSERFIRVYVKESDYIRFEVEFKGTQAVTAWKMVKNGKRYAMAGVLLHEIASLPYAPVFRPMKGCLLRHSDVEIKVPTQRKTSTNTTKLRWLASLLPTIERMMNDHDYGNMVTGWFLDLVEKRVRE